MTPLFVPLVLVWSCVLLFLPGGNGTINLYLYINDVRHHQPVRNGSTRHLHHDRTVDLSCQYDNTLHFQPPKLIEVTQDGSQVSNFQVRTSIDGLNRPFIDYTLPAGQATGVHIYRCTYGGTFIQVTINFDGDQTTTRPPITTPRSTRPPITTPRSTRPHATTPHNTRPSVGGGGQSDQFTGLNPLIYTISAVILLGTLAIVAIITCWIRARRSFNSRSLRSNNTPQDYLDYISDNEFTPMTTSEFLASLQERPPTYNESEQIQSRITQEGDGERSDNRPPNSEQRQGRETGGSGENTNTEASGSSVAGPSSSSEARSSRRDTSGDATMQASGNSAEPGLSQARPSSSSEARSSHRDTSGDATMQANSRDLPVVGDLLGVDLDVPVQLEAVPQQPVDILTPTQEQISEIEATVGAVNERMRQIRQRERELNLRLQDDNREGDAVTGTLDTEDIFLFNRPV